jgi:hypothetical protein
LRLSAAWPHQDANDRDSGQRDTERSQKPDSDGKSNAHGGEEEC